MNDGFDKNPSAVLRRAFLHCGVALLRLVRKTRRALQLELFSNPSRNHTAEVR
jgi:hypothetical protein